MKGMRSSDLALSIPQVPEPARSGRLRRQGQKSSPSQDTVNGVTTTYIIIAFG